jgi:hypothetical protein
MADEPVLRLTFDEPQNTKAVKAAFLARDSSNRIAQLFSYPRSEPVCWVYCRECAKGLETRFCDGSTSHAEKACTLDTDLWVAS